MAPRNKKHLLKLRAGHNSHTYGTLLAQMASPLSRKKKIKVYDKQNYGEIN